MKPLIYSLLFLFCCSGCNSNGEKSSNRGSEMAFDKTKWRLESEDDYLYRDKMIKDLVGNAKLRGLTKDEVINLLGEPTRSDTNYLFYRVSQARLGFFILHAKSLVIKFAADTTVEWVKIHE